jgi:transcriptional regulator GlxA family with amidase domain
MSLAGERRRFCGGRDRFASGTTGLKPTEYCLRLRVGKAREMLEFTNKTIEQIAWAIGYEDPGSFRKVVHRVVGLSPGEYRRRFAVALSA